MHLIIPLLHLKFPSLFAKQLLLFPHFFFGGGKKRKMKYAPFLMGPGWGRRKDENANLNVTAAAVAACHVLLAAEYDVYDFDPRTVIIISPLLRSSFLHFFFFLLFPTECDFREQKRRGVSFSSWV